MRTIGTVCLTCRRKECASSGGTPYNSASTLPPWSASHTAMSLAGSIISSSEAMAAPRSSMTTRILASPGVPRALLPVQRCDAAYLNSNLVPDTKAPTVVISYSGPKLREEVRASAVRCVCYSFMNPLLAT